jgi:hypothetical protein
MKVARGTFVLYGADAGRSLGACNALHAWSFKMEFQQIQSDTRAVRANDRFLRDIRSFVRVQKFFKKVKKRLVSLYFLS